jgi:FtsP/CotA-like multicopper oxidase with cupredoxin domain
MKVVAAVLLLALGAANAAPLRDMPVLQSSNGRLDITMKMEPFRYEAPLEFNDNFHFNSTFRAKFWTRVYNSPGPMAPKDILPIGPTWKIRRGDQVTVRLENHMVTPPGHVDHGDHHGNHLNGYNITNLHTHGLHVSAMYGADYVIEAYGPGEGHTYRYDLHEDHHAGLSWYHPHRHGSTAVQVAGGMCGAILVEDERGTVPDEVIDMPDHIMVISVISTDMLIFFIPMAADDLMGKDLVLDPLRPFCLTNGQYKPELTVNQGQNTRLRFVHGGMTTGLGLRWKKNTASCSMHLLAKDGIYVSPAPRVINNPYLTSGGRFDIVVKCMGTGMAIIASGEPGAEPEEPNFKSMWGGGIAEFVCDLIELHVQASDFNEPDIPTFEAYRPDYLADLTTYSGEKETWALDFGGTNGECLVNGAKYMGPENGPNAEFMVGGVVEFEVTGIEWHPFHLHVNPFQLVGMNDPTNSGAYVTGDWHDTLLLPPPLTVERVRFATDRYTSHAVFHCHFLHHEDEGCMGFVDINGVEDTRTPLKGHPLNIFPPATEEVVAPEIVTVVEESDNNNDDDEEAIMIVVLVFAIIALVATMIAAIMSCVIYSRQNASAQQQQAAPPTKI